LALKAGVPVKVISERLGHESPAFTLKQYAHVILGCRLRLPLRSRNWSTRGPGMFDIRLITPGNEKSPDHRGSFIQPCLQGFYE
jgi:hypothetical protein